ncbi:hypothetical protein ACVWWL_000058 [Bradyrhizobium sp. USDA 3696]
MERPARKAAQTASLKPSSADFRVRGTTRRVLYGGSIWTAGLPGVFRFRNKLPFLLFLAGLIAGVRKEEDMKLRPFAAAGLVLAFVAPALAANEFYIAQDVKTKRCTIIDKKPTDTSMTVVSPSDNVYRTRAEADTGMTTVRVCSSY